MKVRNTARLIWLNELDQILLFKVDVKSIIEPKARKPRAVWVSPGGQIEPKKTAL